MKYVQDWLVCATRFHTQFLLDSSDRHNFSNLIIGKMIMGGKMRHLLNGREFDVKVAKFMHQTVCSPSYEHYLT